MALKWIFDRIVSLIGLLFLWPVFIVVAILIKVKMPGGPVLFTQKRVGQYGHLFTMCKFRSMTVSHSGSSVSVAGESRITPLGATLRKYKLDELPELWNVLKGDMSVVGPRPERPYFVEQFKETIPKYMVKHQVKPGLTGWAQIHGCRGDTSIKKRIEYDIEYVENWHMGLDLAIMIKTALKKNPNAY